MDHDVGSQIGAAALAVWIVQKLKLKLIGHANGRLDPLCRTFSVIFAGITTVGIEASYDGRLGQLVISGLTPENIASNIMHCIVTWAQNFAMQEMIYRGAVKPHFVPMATAITEGRFKPIGAFSLFSATCPYCNLENHIVFFKGAEVRETPHASRCEHYSGHEPHAMGVKLLFEKKLEIGRQSSTRIHQ